MQSALVTPGRWQPGAPRTAPEIMFRSAVRDLLRVVCEHKDCFLAEAWFPVNRDFQLYPGVSLAPAESPHTAAVAAAAEPGVPPLKPGVMGKPAVGGIRGGSKAKVKVEASAGGTDGGRLARVKASVAAAGQGSPGAKAAAAGASPGGSAKGVPPRSPGVASPRHITFNFDMLQCAKQLVINTQAADGTTTSTPVTAAVARKYALQHTLSLKLCHAAMRARRMQWCITLHQAKDKLLSILRVPLSSALAFPVVKRATLHAVIVLYSNTLTKVRGCAGAGVGCRVPLRA